MNNLLHSIQTSTPNISITVNNPNNPNKPIKSNKSNKPYELGKFNNSFESPYSPYPQAIAYSFGIDVNSKQDIIEKIDIESESIDLALNTLNMTYFDYNSLDVDELIMRKKICNVSTLTCALNILIHYKQKKSFFPQTSPIKNNSHINYNYFDEINGTDVPKIHPEFIDFDDVV